MKKLFLPVVLVLFSLNFCTVESNDTISNQETSAIQSNYQGKWIVKEYSIPRLGEQFLPADGKGWYIQFNGDQTFSTSAPNGTFSGTYEFRDGSFHCTTSEGVVSKLVIKGTEGNKVIIDNLSGTGVKFCTFKVLKE